MGITIPRGYTHTSTPTHSGTHKEASSTFGTLDYLLSSLYNKTGRTGIQGPHLGVCQPTKISFFDPANQAE